MNLNLYKRINLIGLLLATLLQLNLYLLPSVARAADECSVAMTWTQTATNVKMLEIKWVFPEFKSNTSDLIFMSSSAEIPLAQYTVRREPAVNGVQTVYYNVPINAFNGEDPSRYQISTNYADPGGSCANESISAPAVPANDPDNDLEPPTNTPGTNTPPPDTAGSTKDEPCKDKTGSSKTSCLAREACEERKSEGRVFARAFNNACVTLPEFVETLVNYVMMFAAVIAGFMFLQGGIKVIASRGNPAAIVEARSMLINAGVGLVLLATSYIIIQFLSDAFGGVSGDINLLGPFAP